MDCKEIISGSDLRERLLRGINNLSKTVLHTMGPEGKTVILMDYEGNYVTKDGVSVARKVKFKDPVENQGAQMLKEVALKTLEEAGDGTSTSICLANSFVTTGYSLLSSGLSYNYVRDQLKLIEKLVLEQLRKRARELKDSDIIDVATISANNDIKIGSIIKEAYNHSNIIKIEEGKDKEDKLELVRGMELQTTYFDKAFLNNMKKQAIIDTNLYVIIIDGTLDRLNVLTDVINSGNKYIIIAEHFSEECMNILKDNHNRNSFTVVPIKAPGFGQHRKDLLQDISMYTGGVVINPLTVKKVNNSYLGKVDSVEVYNNRCLITSAKQRDNFDLYIKDLKEALLSVKDEHEKDLLEKRIEYLTGKVSTIIVGGNSELEMKERKDRVDDAVRAVGASLVEGIVEGGGLALVRAYDELSSKEEININLLMCILSPFFNIYKESEKITEALNINNFENRIVDPFKVTRCALQNAISVSMAILSTEAVVLNEDLW